MRTVVLLTAVGVLASTALAQNPRSSTNLSNGTSASFDAIPASQGDVSLVAYVNDSNEVRVSKSDGRGISWSAAARLDADNTGARKDINDPSQVQFGSGSNVYVLWQDRRLNGSDEQLYFNSSSDGGSTWGTESLIFTGDAVAARMAVSPGTVSDTIYVALAEEPGGDEILRLLTSTDSGANFTSNDVAQGTAGDVDSFDMKAVGTTVHVAWDDDRGGQDDAYYNRSDDGGSTWVHASDLQVDGSATGNTDFNVGIAVSGTLVAVCMADEDAGAGEEIWVNSSTNGGTSFNGAVQVGGYTPGTDDCDNPRVMISGSNIIAVWEDNRTGGDEIYAATSTDNGVNWTESASFGGGGFPRVSNVTSGSEAGCGLAWTSASFPNDHVAAISQDNGVTWVSGGSFVVSDTTGDVDFAEITWNNLYNNYVCTWLSDDATFNDAYVGGVRPQSLAANGFVAGPTSVNFDFSGFEPATASEAWVFVSLATGSTTIPDGRELGIAYDLTFQFSFRLALQGTLGATLVSGAGSTPLLPADLTAGAGLTLYAIGISVDYTNPYDEITDILQIDL